MTTQIYFTASAVNPVELAEKNLLFYENFVATWGCSNMHKDLWLGQTLANFIHAFVLYARQSGDKKINAKAKHLNDRYEELYYLLTGIPYTSYSPKSTVNTY